MRYILNGNGYLQEVSFGADIECNGKACTEYTGGVPSGYSSLADWFSLECDKLYRWKIVGNQLTLDSSAAAPAEYIPVDVHLHKTLDAAGWYKIGRFIPATGSGSLRIYVGGQFNQNNAPSAVVEITSGYRYAKAVTVVPTPANTHGISKIAVTNPNSDSAIDVFVYYKQTVYNSVEVVVQRLEAVGSFAPVDFEPVTSFNEANASAVTDLYTPTYTKRTILWENASPTSIFPGQTVTLKDSWANYDSIGFQCDKGYGEMIPQTGKMCYVAWYFGNDNGSVVVTHRSAEVVSGGIKIGDVQTLTTGGYATQNDRITPLRIYGIKGALK